MRHWIAGMFLTLAMTGAAMAQGGGAADDIQGTIDAQIAAFLADDFETAFSYASPAIRRIFGTTERFAAMVTDAYAMVYRPADVRYQELREIGGALWQKVMVRDQAGVFHMLDYQMIPTADGWRINGVQLLAAPQLGV